MKALIDADVIVYRVGYTTEDEEEFVAQARCDEMMHSILDATKADDYHCYLSDGKEGNYRYQIFPAYKANRTQPRPKHYQFLKEYILKSYKASIATGQEADDALGIEQCLLWKDYQGLFGEDEPSVICSIDKDLLQIPGLHYNFVKGEIKYVTEWDGIKHFWNQVLQGDRADNIPGLPGIGPVKSERALRHCNNEEELFLAAREKYIDTYGEEGWEAAMRLAGKLLWIRREENEAWEIPTVREVQEQVGNEDSGTTIITPSFV